MQYAHTAPVVVTGAAGFIGSRVAARLAETGHRVIGIDNLNDAYDVCLKHWRLAQLQAMPGFEFYALDITDRAALAHLMETAHPQPAAVINLAARAGVRQSVLDPWVYVDTNMTGTLNLLEICRQYDIPKFVLASSSSLYGQDNPTPWSETQCTDYPLSPYAASKKAAEAMCYTYHHLYGLDATVYRFFSVYGPAGRPDMAPFRFVQWIVEGRPVTVYGDGAQSRDFTYVDDIAAGVLAGLRPVGYEVINLGSDQPIVLADAIRTVERLTGKTAQIDRRPANPADMPATWACIDKAEHLLGWRPQVTFEEGMRRLVDWYLENRAWAAQIVTG